MHFCTRFHAFFYKERGKLKKFPALRAGKHAPRSNANMSFNFPCPYLGEIWAVRGGLAVKALRCGKVPIWGSGWGIGGSVIFFVFRNVKKTPPKFLPPEHKKHFGYRIEGFSVFSAPQAIFLAFESSFIDFPSFFLQFLSEFTRFFLTMLEFFWQVWFFFTLPISPA